MSNWNQFRIVLPLAQCMSAAFFGGWGWRIRAAILDRQWAGNSLWESTARYHVWPWQLKFAIVTNLPAFFAGGLASIPACFASQKLTEGLGLMLCLPFVGLLWFLVGRRLDRCAIGNRIFGPWMLIAALMAIFFFGAINPIRFAGEYTGFVQYGACVWCLAGIALAATLGNSRRETA